jgi:lipoyl(octanoyl) transferase
VWAPVGDTHVKIAAIGIRVAEKVTMHGFAMNCNNSLDAYDTIIACGIKDAATSTISKLLNREVTPAMAAEIIQKRLVEIEKVSN